MKVKLEDVIEQIELANESNRTYLNKSTGEIHLIPEEVDMYIENEVFDEDDLPDWEKEIVPIAKDILENPENYIPFPDKYDINEYEIMERFTLSLTDDKMREEIYYSIKGKGAFRRFKGKIFQHGIENDWYKFKEEWLKEIAIDWCKENNIEFY